MDLPEELYYFYVLLSMKDMKQYVGYTHNLNIRLEQHEKGLVPSTKDRRPLKLIYFEACLNQQDATKREKYFKTHYGSHCDALSESRNERSRSEPNQARRVDFLKIVN